MVFQRPVLLRRSAAGNLRYALRSRGVRGAALHERCQHWLAKAGLVALAKRPARVLSGGEQQRLALARVLCLDPEVLFLDEPTASLDPASIVAIEAIIDDAHHTGTKIVLVTHDLGQARRMADEVVFMCAGRIEARAPASEFFADPKNAKARAFLEGEVVV
jgi:tungstate transport system ATP-binding protein